MKHLTLIILTLSMTACRTDYLSEQELTQYLLDEDNGLKKTVNRGNLSFTVLHRPSDLLVAQDVDNLQDTAAVNKAMNRYNAYLYFILQMSNQGRELLGSDQRYSVGEYISTISFGMQPYTRLTTPQLDTIPVTDYIYSRTFGYGSSTDLLFVFDREEALTKDKIIFNLDEFGLGTGNLRFGFETKDIQNTPKLEALKPYYEP